MVHPTSTLARLRSELQGIEEELAALIAISPVELLNRKGGFLVFVGGPDYYFSKRDSDQLRLQIPLKGRYDKWLERFGILFRTPPPELGERIAEAKATLSRWIDLGSHNYDLVAAPAMNVVSARNACKPFYDFLSILDGKGEIIVVPDTNAIIASSDPTKYQGIAGAAEFTFLLLPTVLAELDNLKNFARDVAFREKVGQVVRRIKGWRRQGALHEGVTLHRTIQVRAIAEEPDVRGTLHWLDPSNRDDRIVASVLGIQVLAPSARVVLVTSDINLQNKADAAKLPCAETP
jgi:hypothetical protein